ncbi:inositol phosphophingolipids phospholipase C [Lactarius hatsudake]|nr:inositol phosphophingolipids phospholipase C [Lactarius hatsudake]
MSTTVETRIDVFSLNCWGLKYVSKRRSERIQAIARFLESSDFDIVALQELWVYADYEIVRSCLSKSLPFSKFFYSGALGAGLAIFSRFPIVAAAIHPYSLNGSPLDVLGGDWFVGKAAASVVIRHPTLGQVQVSIPMGRRGGPSITRAHRLVNAWEFAKLAKQAAELDFNSVPTSLPMTVIREHASLSDAWEGTHPATSPSIASTLVYLPTQASLDVHARTFHGKRLDYIFFRDPVSPLASAAPPPTLVAADARVLLTDTVPGLPFSYSDHFGVSATLHIRSPWDEFNHASPDDGHITAQKQMPSAISTPFTPTRRPFLGSLVTCHHHADARAKRHLLVFAFSLVLGRFPPKATPFVVLGSAVFTWLGTTMFYVGFVHGRWEVNALLNVIDELGAIPEECGSGPDHWRVDVHQTLGQ